MTRAYPALIKIAREEGVGAWYRGFAPKVLRLGPGGGVLLLGKFIPFFGSAMLISQLSRLYRLCSGTISVLHMFRFHRLCAYISPHIPSIEIGVIDGILIAHFHTTSTFPAAPVQSLT
jgi:hypothetical protein